MLPIDINAVENYNPQNKDNTTIFLELLKDWKGTGNQKIVNNLKSEITFLIHSKNTFEILTAPDEIKRIYKTGNRYTDYQQTISIGYVQGTVDEKDASGNTVKQKKDGLFAYKSAGLDRLPAPNQSGQMILPLNQTQTATTPAAPTSESFNITFNKALKRFK